MKSRDQRNFESPRERQRIDSIYAEMRVDESRLSITDQFEIRARVSGENLPDARGKPPLSGNVAQGRTVGTGRAVAHSLASQVQWTKTQELLRLIRNEWLRSLEKLVAEYGDCAQGEWFFRVRWVHASALFVRCVEIEPVAMDIGVAVNVRESDERRWKEKPIPPPGYQ